MKENSDRKPFRSGQPGRDYQKAERSHRIGQSERNKDRRDEKADRKNFGPSRPRWLKKDPDELDLVFFDLESSRLALPSSRSRSTISIAGMIPGIDGS
jgi:hypothetical protein